MALFWLTGEQAGTTTSVGLVDSTSVYSNGRTVTGQITLVQKAVVVATHLFGLTDKPELFRIRLAVVEEAVTPTAGEPEDQDKRIKGLYPFSMGPVYFSPRRKIEIPSEHELFIITEKLQGGTAVVSRVHWRFLLHTSLA